MLNGDNDLSKRTSTIARLSNLSVAMPTQSRTAIRRFDSWHLIGAPQTSPIDVLPSTMRPFSKDHRGHVRPKFLLMHMLCTREAGPFRRSRRICMLMS